MTDKRRLAVVTGGGGGIGRGIVLALAKQGYDIAFSWYGDEALANATKADVEALGARCLTAECDAGVKVEVDAFFDQVEAFGGPADFLVNNAGIQTWASLLELEEAAWDRVIRTNLKGCFLNTQAFARRLVAAKKPGSIVNLGSGCNKLAFPNLVDYTASKGGIEMLTKVAAVELGPYGIRVNCVAPGAVETERTLAEAGDYAGVWSPITPLRRVGYVDDIADVVVFMDSEGARFISGQTIGVDGGVYSQANWPYRPGEDR